MTMNIVKHIPNTITSMNLLSGVLGVIFAFEGRFDISFYLMIAAGIFDFCDGLSARALKAYSNIGKELDSLADLISFGLLPAIMLNRFMIASINPESNVVMTIVCYIPLVIVVFSALRLAKFNVDERQTSSFIGLATPACAIICGSFIYFVSHDVSTSLNELDPSFTFLTEWARSPYLIPIMSVVLAGLLVSEIPMFSMKIKKGVKPDFKTHIMRMIFFGVFILSCLIVPICGGNWSLIPLITFVAYVLINICGAFFPDQE